MLGRMADAVNLNRDLGRHEYVGALGNATPDTVYRAMFDEVQSRKETSENFLN